MNFVEALEHLLPVIDNVHERWSRDRDRMMSKHQENPEIPRVTCTKGCGACCYFPIIPATAGEAFVLLARLLAEGRTMEDLHNQLMPYARRYISRAQRENSLPLNDAQQRAFLQERLPCPLFVSTPEKGALAGHCGVFGVRPQICDFYHSLEDPGLCLLKKPHASFTDISERGHDSIEEIRQAERAIFGRSALGHLPLLLAALLTEDGLATFLTPVEAVNDEENAQDIRDFGLYIRLLESLGYAWSEGDWESLAKAQEEVI